MESIAQMRPAARIAAAAVLWAAFAAGYIDTFRWLFDRYTAADTYYSHGFLVPLVSAYLIWAKRHSLRTIPLRGLFAGLVLLAGSVAVHILAAALEIYFVSSFSLLGVLFGASLYMFGSVFTRRIAFPLAFIVFMLPLPLVAINAVSMPLKSAVTAVSTVMLSRLIGLPVRSEGFQIFLPHGGSLTVENPCSGLRSLIVLLALGAVFGYLIRGRFIRRAAVFLLTIPVAFIANIVRVIVLCLGVYVYGNGFAEGPAHEMTGYAVFIVSFFVLWGARRRLG